MLWAQTHILEVRGFQGTWLSEQTHGPGTGQVQPNPGSKWFDELDVFTGQNSRILYGRARGLFWPTQPQPEVYLQTCITPTPPRSDSFFSSPKKKPITFHFGLVIVSLKHAALNVNATTTWKNSLQNGVKSFAALFRIGYRDFFSLRKTICRKIPISYIFYCYHLI
jgi:hypothetical protein